MRWTLLLVLALSLPLLARTGHSGGSHCANHAAANGQAARSAGVRPGGYYRSGYYYGYGGYGYAGYASDNASSTVIPNQPLDSYQSRPGGVLPGYNTRTNPRYKSPTLASYGR